MFISLQDYRAGAYFREIVYVGFLTIDRRGWLIAPVLSDGGQYRIVITGGLYLLLPPPMGLATFECYHSIH